MTYSKPDPKRNVYSDLEVVTVLVKIQPKFNLSFIFEKCLAKIAVIKILNWY